jgi:hypothetical protein
MDQQTQPLHEQPLHTSHTLPHIKEHEKTSIVTLMCYCTIIVFIFYLIYYAYQQFLSNRCSDGFVAGLEQERTDTVVDFDLRGKINQLENMQRNILNNLSNNTNL